MVRSLFAKITLTVLILGGSVFVLGSCGSPLQPRSIDTGISLGTFALTILSGNHQSTAAHAVFTQSLSVSVQDKTGVRIPDVPITWLVTSGTGTFSVPASITDSAGVASSILTAEVTSGPLTATATIYGTQVSVTFTETITP